MSTVWIVLALLVLFFIWAGWKLKGRTQSAPIFGPSVIAERDGTSKATPKWGRLLGTAPAS